MRKRVMTAAVAAAALASGMLVAAPASATTAGGHIWAAGQFHSSILVGPVAAGSTPNIATPPSGPAFQVVWQGLNGHLFTTGPNGPADLQVALADNTSPSLAELGTSQFFPNGGWAVAFQGSNHDLWFDTQVYGPSDTNLAMAPGTSPSIVAMSNDGAFQAVWHGANGDLWSTGPHGPIDTGLAMYPGTNPSLTELGGTHEEVAFEGANGDLRIYGSNNPGDTAQQMAPGTSPAVISYGTGFLIAYHGLDGNLITTGVFGDARLDIGTHEWFHAMVPGTSPSMVDASGNPAIAFALNDAGFGPIGEIVTFDPVDAQHEPGSDEYLTDGRAVGAPNTGSSIAQLRCGFWLTVFQAST